MWDGCSNWGFWPMQQSAYSNMPSDQVDWAMLAKQWIAQRGMVGMGPMDYPQPPGAAPPPPFPSVKPEPPAGPIGEVSSGLGGVMAQPHPQAQINCDMENSNSQDSNYYPSSEPDQVPAEGWGNWNGAAMPAWAVPPPPPPMDEAHDSTTNEMSYRGDANQFMGPPFGFNQPTEDMYMGPYEHAGFPQFWNQGPMPGQPMMAQKPFGPVRENLEYRAPPKRGSGVRAAWPTMGDIPPLMDDSGIDAAKRRHLPLWIREGLEKMEREKQRQMEKERHEQAVQDAKKAREEAQKEGGDQDGPQTVVKSIFDSDDEEPPAEPTVIHQQPVSRSLDGSGANERTKSPSPIKQHVEEEEEEEEEAPMTEEEKLAHMMSKVRQMMTEVLLEVTNREMMDVAQTVFASEKRKQAKGLGYGSESSDEDASDDERRLPNEESDDTDDDVAMRQRILQKKTDFERKMREMEEKERANEVEKRRHAEEHLKPQKSDRDAESNDDAPVPVAETDEAPSRKDKETAGKRVKQSEDRTKKGEKRAAEQSRSERQKRSKKVEEEEEEDETSEETSGSGSEESSSESQSGSSDESSSSTSRSKKSRTESKELNRGRIKSQLSDEARDRKKVKSDTGQKKTEERDSKAGGWDGEVGRKEGKRQGKEQRVEEEPEKEERSSRKKSSRHHSEEKSEYEKVDQKRRRSTKDDERPDETKTKRGQTNKDKTDDRDKTRGHKDSRGHQKRSRDDRSRSEDDNRRDYPTKTYDDEDRTHRSRHKKARHSRSSSQSSHDQKRSRRSRDKELSPPDQRRSAKDRRSSDQYREHKSSRDRMQQSSRDRRSSRDEDRQSSRDRDRRRKETKDRSGKKDRARGRSRSQSRSDDS